MQRFILSAFSVLLATGAVATEAQALPKVDPSFELQGLRLQELDTRNKGVSASFELQKIRLQEFDTRNKSEDYSQPYYPSASSQPAAQSTQNEQYNNQNTEAAAQSETQWEAQPENQWQNAESQEVASESASTELSLIDRRHQVLDRD